MQGPASEHSDWTEKYRPRHEGELVGNKDAINSVKKWIKEWDNGIPKKKCILLVGPPGVGKTSIARAIAFEKNWNIIELNASEERNAAAIRKVATSGAVNSSLFSYEGEIKRSIILLDEVDHMSGKISKISEKRIFDNLSADKNPNTLLSGDSGGKAELINLISNTREPIILACNDAMRFWGLGSGWKERRNRFMKNMDLIQFKRASNIELREIANRILKSEGYEIQVSALEKLISVNGGDIRALIKDLQSVALISSGEILMADVERQISIGSRDHAIDLFPGLEKLYKSSSAKLSNNIMTNLDKTPDEMIAWISWNNPRILSDIDTIKKSAELLSFADNILPVIYENKAYRSWYWGSNICALSTILANVNSRNKLFLNFPDFLRRSNEGVKRHEIINQISKKFDIGLNTSKSEIYPLIQGFYNEKINKEWPYNIYLSRKLGLDFNQHVFISKLDPNKKSTKNLLEKYEKRDFNPKIKSNEEIKNANDEKPDGQSTLF
tara:strand:+ start:16129 stop:17622 length:1494 start_codon:yes stop_codon:yes gene_type:complete